MRRAELLRRIAEIEKAKKQIEDPEYNSALAWRAQKRMMRVDEMPKDIRQCVYEYGLEIVQEFLNHGCKKASSIRHLVDTVRHADFPGGNARFKLNSGPNRKPNPANEDDEYYGAAK